MEAMNKQPNGGDWVYIGCRFRRGNMKHEIVGIRLSMTVAVLAWTVAGSAQQTSNIANPAVTGKGTVGNIPMWDTTSDIVNSVMF
jgi:hypothetical protein